MVYLVSQQLGERFTATLEPCRLLPHCPAVISLAGEEANGGISWHWALMLLLLRDYATFDYAK
jgi:hypothetical protein